MHIEPIQKNFIHGRFVETQLKQTFPNLNPANLKTLCQVEEAGQTEIDKAAESAVEGQAVWARISPAKRLTIMQRAASILRDQHKAIAKIESIDCGKPISESLSFDVFSAADTLDYFASLSISQKGSLHSFDNSFSYTKNIPLGVIGAIGAWNYPLQIASWKAAPALASGNAVVYKPSQLTPLTANILAQIFMEAGLPPGVFNVVHGAEKTGQMLTTHPLIAKISVTGSVATGKKVMQNASQFLKPCTLELGGKSPILVFADCDLHQAVSGVMMGNFYTQGEICSNGTRVFVERKIHNAFVSLLKERTEKLVLGCPMEASTQVGALISKAHAASVIKAIKKGVQDGAKLLTGGRHPRFPAASLLEEECFVEPTIFTDCHDDMDLVKHEIFGPVAAILSFDSEKEAIERANNSPYGLASGVFTSDLKRAHRVSDKMESGVCWVNNYNVTPPGLAFGGMKNSGLGRENAYSTLKNYTQEKTVYMELGSVDCPYD